MATSAEIAILIHRIQSGTNGTNVVEQLIIDGLNEAAKDPGNYKDFYDAANLFVELRDSSSDTRLHIIGRDVVSFIVGFVAGNTSPSSNWLIKILEGEFAGKGYENYYDWVGLTFFGMARQPDGTYLSTRAGNYQPLPDSLLPPRLQVGALSANGNLLTSPIGAGGLTWTVVPVTGNTTRPASSTFINMTGGNTATLKAGGTLSDIVAIANASGNAITLDDLRTINGLTPAMDGKLKIGQKLIVPTRVGDVLNVNYGDVNYTLNRTTSEYGYTVKGRDSFTVISHTVDSASGIAIDQTTQSDLAGNLQYDGWSKSDGSFDNYTYSNGMVVDRNYRDSSGATTRIQVDPNNTDNTRVVQYDPALNLETVTTQLGGNVFQVSFDGQTNTLSFTENNGTPFVAYVDRTSNTLTATVNGKTVVFAAEFTSASNTDVGSIKIAEAIGADYRPAGKADNDAMWLMVA